MLILNSGYGDHLDSLKGLNSEGGHHILTLYHVKEFQNAVVMKKSTPSSTEIVRVAIGSTSS